MQARRGVIRSARPKSPCVTSVPPIRVRRDCVCGGKCDGCQQAATTGVPEVVRDALTAPGQPLDQVARSTLEPRFGHDFGRVRIHTDAAAAEASRSIDALAFTVGDDIVFGAMQYRPQTSAGLNLLAHELTHVVQQGGTPPFTDLALGDPSDPLEQEADHAARELSSPATLASPPTEHRSGVVRRQKAGSGPHSAASSGANQSKEARLRGMSAYPGRALAGWSGLSQADRDAVLWQMIDRYGIVFSSDFLEYARGNKKPSISISVTNAPDITPKWLTDHGFRFASNPGGIPQWVHPSGREYWLLSPPKPSPKDDPADLQTRCGDPCMDSTDDEAACHECCDREISADDVRCRRNCHVTCALKL